MTVGGVGMALAVALLVGLIVAASLTPVMMKVARRIGYIDRPGGHKSHATPTPYGGGIALTIAGWGPVLFALLAATLIKQESISAILGETIGVYFGGLQERRLGVGWTLLGGAFALHVLGLYDDLRPLGAWPKLIILVAVASLVTAIGDIRIARFLGENISIALTVLWLLVVINALNFLDNMDGLSAGVAAIAMSFLVVCGLLAGQVLTPLMGCLFVGALLGFLLYNFPPARVFMGDAGSLVTGYMLAVMAVRTTYYESASGTPAYALFIPLVVLAVPLYDFVTVVWIRLREGRNPMRGDQRHFSHRLLDHGLSRTSAVLTIYLATATTGVAATLLPNATARESLSVGAVTIMVLLIIAILETPANRTR